jgi:hypothetical protein
MVAARLDGRSVIRELLPQDLKIEIERLTGRDKRPPAFLPASSGKAHARQMTMSPARLVLGTGPQSHLDVESAILALVFRCFADWELRSGLSRTSPQIRPAGAGLVTAAEHREF